MKEMHPPCRWLHFLDVGEATLSYTGLWKVCKNPFIITEEKFYHILGLDVLKKSLSYTSLIYLLDTRTCPTVSAAAPWKSCFLAFCPNHLSVLDPPTGYNSLLTKYLSRAVLNFSFSFYCSYVFRNIMETFSAWKSWTIITY